MVSLLRDLPSKTVRQRAVGGLAFGGIVKGAQRTVSGPGVADVEVSPPSSQFGGFILVREVSS